MVLKYLIYILDYKLHYIRYSTILKSYGDANWIFDTTNSKSTSLYIFTLNRVVEY